MFRYVARRHTQQELPPSLSPRTPTNKSGCGHYSSCIGDDPNWDCKYQNICPSEDAGTNDKPSSFPPPHSPPLSPFNECYPQGDGIGLFPLPWINTSLRIDKGWSPLCPNMSSRIRRTPDPIEDLQPYDSYIFPPCQR